METWLSYIKRRLLIHYWRFKSLWRGPWYSPFGIRRSLRILANNGSTTPTLDLLRLLWPVYPWEWPTQLPDNPRFLRDHPEVIHERYEHIYEYRLMPIYRWRDTPQRSLYRMYECFCGLDDNLVGYEAEYFWKHREPTKWQLDQIEDPGEHGDPERRAVLAALIEELVAAFNWRLEWGLRRRAPPVERADDGTPAPFVPYRCPDWVATVPRLKNRLVLDADGESDSEDEDECDGAPVRPNPWKRLNISSASRRGFRTI